VERYGNRFTLYAFLAFVLVVIVIHLWPRLFVGYTSGSPVLPLGPRGEGYYLAPVEQVRLGRTNFNHSIYYELKDEPDTPAMEANIRAFAWLAAHTDLSLLAFTSVIYAVCIIVLVCQFGWIFFRQTGNGIWTIAFTAVAIMEADYLCFRAHPYAILVNRLGLPVSPDELNAYLPYMRPMNPQASTIILLGLAGLLSSFLPAGPGEKPRPGQALFVRRMIAFLIAAHLALAIHTYYFLALYVAAVCVALLAVTLWRSEFRYLARPVGLGLLGGLAVSLPFALSLLARHSGLEPLDPSSAINAVHTRLPAVTPPGFLCLLAALYLAKELKAGDVRAAFPLVLNLAVPMAENAHLVTGLMIEPFQVGWYYSAPALVSGFAWWVGGQAYLRDDQFWGIRSSLAVLVGAMLLGGFQLRYSMQVDLPRFGEERDLAAVFDQTAPLEDGECVVLASERVSDLVRLYTPCRVYGQFAGVRGTGPRSRNVDRLQRMGSVFGVSWEGALAQLDRKAPWKGWGGHEAPGYVFGSRGFGYLFMNRRPLTDPERERFRSQYTAVNAACIDYRDPFRLDYIVTLGDEDAYLRPGRLCQEIEPVVRSGAARLYRVTDRPREP